MSTNQNQESTAIHVVDKQLAWNIRDMLNAWTRRRGIDERVVAHTRDWKTLIVSDAIPHEVLEKIANNYRGVRVLYSN